MFVHEAKSWSMWCQGEGQRRPRKNGDILLCQVNTGVTALAQQARRLKET